MWIIVDHHGATSDRFLPNVRLIFFGSGRNTPKMENKNMQDFCRSLKPTFFPPEILARAPNFRKVHRFQPLKISGRQAGTVSGEG